MASWRWFNLNIFTDIFMVIVLARRIIGYNIKLSKLCFCSRWHAWSQSLKEVWSSPIRKGCFSHSLILIGSDHEVHKPHSKTFYHSSLLSSILHNRLKFSKICHQVTPRCCSFHHIAKHCNTSHNDLQFSTLFQLQLQPHSKTFRHSPNRFAQV